MLTTRLWMGAVLILLAVGLVTFDPAPWFPLLLVLSVVTAGLACLELINLLPAPQPRPWLTHLCVAAVIAANWPARVFGVGTEWQWVSAAVVGGLMLALVVEATHFRQPGGAVGRVSMTFWITGYVALLASFFIQLRWLPGSHGPVAMAMAIFVPKCGDIGAYFTGRALGKHKMAPVLSPKKTWEGAAGGLAASVLIAVGFNEAAALFSSGKLLTVAATIGFGLSVGAVAMVGDLVESMIKRDCERKDASAVVPGFGGVLDVLDSILFSAPVAYLWFVSSRVVSSE